MGYLKQLVKECYPTIVVVVLYVGYILWVKIG